MKRNSLKAALLAGLVAFQFAAFGQEMKPDKPTKPAKGIIEAHDHIIYKSVPGPNGVIRCHTMEMDSIRRANNPNLPSLAEEEAALQRQIEVYKAQMQNNSTAKKIQYTIPIIFHIFTDGAGAENISQAQVQAQVDQLNLDYADLAGSSYGQSADTEIQFCLAVVDENGTPLAEPGVNRITTYGQGPFSQTNFENTMKAATQWNPDNYFNVWVADLSGGLLGYAQFPNSSGLTGLNANNGSASTDGVVILYSSVGSVANPFPGGSPYNLGRTLTHEAGHWLGLRHIWGDANCGNDFCADTPESQTSNFGCPTQTTCDGIQDMVENYMDYTNDACMNTFTADQKTRIQTVMSNSPRRGSLGSSMACMNPVADDIGVSTIIVPTGDICAASITPEIEVTNYGNNDVTSFTLTYDIDGAGAQTYNWTGTLAPGQTVTITLGTVSPSVGAHVYNAATSVPNGTADANGANDAGSSNFTMIAGGQTIVFTLNTDCYGEETVWELFDSNSNLVASGGNQNLTTPITSQQNTNASDPGVYASEATIVENWCLAVDCYDLVVYDAYGDGMYGSQWNGCSTDGSFTVEDGQGNVLVTMQAANGDFGFSETNNFCVAPPCASTFSSSTVEETCNGDNDGELTVTFTAGNSLGATYDIGNGPQASGTFTGLSQGTYTVTVIDGDACTSYVSVTLGGPAALAGSTSSVTDENTGNDGAININVSGGTPSYTYAWTGPNGFTATTQNISGLEGGTYSVTITDANGCTTTVNNIVVNSNVGIDELSEGSFLVFPNPSEGIFNVELIGQASSDYQVTVVDIAGRVVYNEMIGESTFKLDLSNAANGTYTMTIQTAKHRMIKRIVVK